jgi:formate dehydrogenase beta subunit
MCTTPCQRSCPAGINISEYIRQIAMGDYHCAVQVIKERNPFPSVIGRICPRPCELDCRRKYIDEPVAINFLKRFASDYEKKMNERILPYKAPETGKKIAVVGGGVEGLSTAFFSARLGHLPTVFEATSKLGGLLRNAISTYRLSHEILDWDIDGILEMGVLVEMGKTMGKDFTVASLLNQGFEAVFLASGGWDSRLAQSRALNIETPVPGMRLLIDVLKDDQIDAKDVLSESDVVISGGGALALEVAEKCVKNGVKNTTVLFRKTRDQIDLTASDIDNIERKGVHVLFNAAITAIAGEDDRLLQVEYTMLNTLLKKNIPANTLIISAGRFPELIFTKTIQEEALENTSLENTSAMSTRWKGVEPGKSSSQSAHMGLFSKSNPVTDFSSAIKAINAGRKAAASIHQAMYKILISVPEYMVTSDSVVQNVDHVEKVTLTSRQIMPLCAVENLDECKEIEKGFTQEAAQKEAERCLQCGLICYEKAQNQAALSADAA